MKKFIFSITLIILGTAFLLFSISWLNELVFTMNSELFQIEIKYTFLAFLMFIIGLGGLVFGLFHAIKEAFPKSTNN